ncbi:hypothetical protein Nepgr_030250 [Nepenthes gracilis]|uniref:Uncharacterized protein n=1 Tax=Nepenthes gracilis TaxID=150966 RepID=A0AAD3Y3R0_NEPGR|nr:hypothetical protein Nepgr_030250 [Nepenthes gracilis]
MQSKPSDLLAVTFICLISISTAVNAIGDHHHHHQFGWLIPSTTSISTCRGTIADCIAGEEELEMDSEINRRMLATTKYISYGALSKNYIPCSLRGASYYNCRTGAQANPYKRGCTRITRCARG